MQYALIALGLVAVVIAIIVFIGWRLRVAHLATRSAKVAASPDAVFALISQPAEYGKWRSDVKMVEVTEENGVTRFREDGSNGPILFEITERVPPRRFVTRIADKSLPFGGRWIYEITPSAGGSELRITEEGEVYNPIFRFVSRYIMGHTSTIDSYLAAVQRHFKP